MRISVTYRSRVKKTGDYDGLNMWLGLKKTNTFRIVDEEASGTSATHKTGEERVTLRWILEKFQ
jgi:hypothetical protein